jgi:hypothetical protein
MTTIAADTTDLDGPLPSRQRELILWQVCAWSGPLFVLAFLSAWAALAGWFPPPREDWDLTTVVHFFVDHSVRIRIGMGVAAFVSGLYLLWTMAIARVMRPMEGTTSAPLTTIQICGGFGTCLAVIFFSTLWSVAGFEASIRDADPHTIQLLNDTGWVAFDLVGIPTMAQMGALGVVLLGRRDPGVPQLMPRWVAYLSLFVTLSFFEVLLLLFFKSGPFAWHGIVTYYVILIGFFGWMAAVSYHTLTALRQLEHAESDS